MLSAVAFLPSDIISNLNEERAQASVSFGDLDGDGDLDLASVYSGDDIAWQKNDGTGNFGDRIVLAAGTHGDSFDTEDLDGDGDLDVLAVNNDGKIAIYVNDGTGDFNTSRVIETRAGGGTVSAADIDNDGDVDVLFVPTVGGIEWYENNGIGEFGEQRNVTTEDVFAASVLTVDMDDDEDLDVVTTGYGEFGEIVWIENDGFGGFGKTNVVGSAIESFRSIYAADVDNDGDADIVSVGQFFSLGFVADDVIWYENTGHGGFGPVHLIAARDDGIARISPADVDGDGDVDLYASQFSRHSSGAIVWYENTGTGNFAPLRVVSAEVAQVWTVYAADVDSDGDVDVISSSLRREIAWYRNEGAGSFGLDIEITKRADGPQSVLAADLDGDGDMDAISASANDDKVAWYENTGAGAFGPQQIITNDAANVTLVFAADFDGDGDTDVLSASRYDDTIAWYPNDGAGKFSSRREIDTPACSAQSVFAADMDGDGDIDILSASAHISSSKISWYENNGNGEFGSEQVITTETLAAWSVHAADLDNDGDLDVLSASRRDGTTIAWYENDGGGTFGSKNVITSNTRGSQSVYAVDVDGDGNVDVLSGSSDRTVAWYKNKGAGEFGAQRLIAHKGGVVRSVFAVDLDGDGDVDVISGSSRQVAWHENLGAGVFERQRVIEMPGRGALLGVTSVFAADMDQDGDVDILSAFHEDDRITWYENRILGDVNNDGVFDSSDLIRAFQSGKYEDDVEGNALFEEGDWNQDGDFNSEDIVYAFHAGRFTFDRRAVPLELSAENHLFVANSFADAIPLDTLRRNRFSL